MQENEEFDKAFEGFGEDDQPITPPEPPVKDDDKPADEKPAEDEKPEEKKEEEVTPPVEEPKKEEPAPVEEPKPITEEGLRNLINEVRNEERTSSRELDTTTSEVLEKYYPDGLSNTLVDERSGKELRTPADVVEVSGGEMTTEEAAQWLMNEQFKLDNQVDKIKNDAKAIAETTVNFKRDSVAAVEKYEPLFKQFPHLQQKVFDKLMKQVQADEEKGVILKSPDVMEHYDDYLEPYQQAYEYGKNQPATNPNPPAPEPAKPTADDRMDISGDGGATPVNDPNDFAQQVNKELAKGI